MSASLMRVSPCRSSSKQSGYSTHCPPGGAAPTPRPRSCDRRGEAGLQIQQLRCSMRPIKCPCACSPPRMFPSASSAFPMTLDAEAPPQAPGLRHALSRGAYACLTGSYWGEGAESRGSLRCRGSQRRIAALGADAGV